MLLSPDALHCLKRKQLTNLCRRFGIKAIGKNADLIQQIQEYAASNIPSDSPTKGNVAILRHVKRPRQSVSSVESGNDDQQLDQDRTKAMPFPPLTPRTRQKRMSDLVQAIEEVKGQTDEMDTDDEDEELRSPQKNTIAFPLFSPASARKLPTPPLSPTLANESADTTQPLRIIKALPSSTLTASPLSTATILEMSRQSTITAETSSNLYPDITSLPIPEGVSSEHLTSSSTLPSITCRQFSAAAASVLAEMNARLTAAGRSSTSGSLTTMSSISNGTWHNLAASASTQGMSKSRSGRYEIHHEKQFKKMDSIVNHYAARRVGGGRDAKPNGAAISTAAPSKAATMAASTSTTQRLPMLASTSTLARRPRVDASTSTRSLAALSRSTSSRKLPPTQSQRRPLPIPPISKAKLPSSLTTTTSRQASNSTEPPRTKRLRLAVTEDCDALQNTVLEIPPEKKTVVICVTRPDREGMPYKFSVSDNKNGDAENGAVRAAYSLKKTVIKATKSRFAGSGAAKKTVASARGEKREAAFVKEQQQQAAISRSISSRANLTASASVGNRFTGVSTTATPAVPSIGSEEEPSAPVKAVENDVRKPSVATSVSSRFGGSIRSSVSQGLGRAEAARQTRLQEIKARTKAALAGFGSQRNVNASTTTSSTTTTLTSPTKKTLLPAGQSFSPSVMRPTIASLSRATANAANTGSASLPMLSAITAQTLPLSGIVASTLQRAATVHGALTPCLTPRSSSLRHLRRVMRKQAKEAEVEQNRVVAAENIAPGAVVPSVILAKRDMQQKEVGLSAKPSIRTVPGGASEDGFTTLPAKTRTRTVGGAAKPAGPRAALVSSRATTMALNRV
ncbi:hypothetical protein NDA14_004483 [Ustilago hordei]|uniref:SAP domain-containing protein n=1 Tax=Ustilago hordei TaxID=120017 RepID=I2G184_USTHO|nr:uncharacterized protein UHO2_03361 [Ustilago hordei]KAJ1581072.1 hypothetical protein NDA15_003795 [Ustilago hordei]KAJ1582969.1 hypothetical protein NDA12_006397 [Ustilago hordei]KAJ1599887.1 hypothetical protein NDA14_004483 [Ustilago hordei]UTT92344.1 hypothetical protein NDA17_007661 [Ustilago hordei]CCF52927.1 uncharacterized protein UHOR_04297 [Ustilago hordei]